MKRWTSISENPEEKRWQALSEQLAAKGCVNEFVPWTGNAATITDLSVFEEFDHVRFSTRLGMQALKLMKIHSSWLTLLGVADGMTKVHGEWWPQCALYESLCQVIVELGQSLDVHGSVLVAGSGGAARAGITAFFKSGFRKFLITDISAEDAAKMIGELQSRFFGMTLEFVPKENIVQLPGESSVLLNCTPSRPDNALLNELSYMNFLKRPGFLFDFSLTDKPSMLVQEAIDAEVDVLSGTEIAARIDRVWSEWAFGTKIDMEAYREGISKILSSAD